MILVVCALASELPGFAEPSGVRLIEGGVGPVEAAAATAEALAQDAYSLVVSAGIAGGFPGRAAIGESVAVVRERFAGLTREDGTPLALPRGYVIADESSADAPRATRLADGGLRCVRGVTVGVATTSDRTAEALRRAHDADVETMEGFAVFRAARRAGVPAIGVRGVSNRVGDPGRADWNLAAGSAAATRGLIRLLALIGP